MERDKNTEIEAGILTSSAMGNGNSSTDEISSASSTIETSLVSGTVGTLLESDVVVTSLVSDIVETSLVSNIDKTSPVSNIVETSLASSTIETPLVSSTVGTLLESDVVVTSLVSDIVETSLVINIDETSPVSNIIETSLGSDTGTSLESGTIGTLLESDVVVTSLVSDIVETSLVSNIDETSPVSNIIETLLGSATIGTSLVSGTTGTLLESNVVVTSLVSDIVESSLGSDTIGTEIGSSTVETSLGSDTDETSLEKVVRRPGVRNQNEEVQGRRLCYFVTDSTYRGTWNDVGMSGQGKYVMPHGVVYEGGMLDGMFHGPGVLTYPSGARVKGSWNKGVAEKMSFVFADGLEVDDLNSWTYCKMPDRRFSSEHKRGLQPAGRSLLTQESPPKHLPDGCYDVGDGVYDPKTKCVHSPNDHSTILRIPTKQEESWIMQHCRRAVRENVGFRPDLYENLFNSTAE
ncbi:uncharacterized protein LOC134535308 [Bacillus rossius redtenbacheri]|uniref:uncharacterized protein LOC134535308 n=1 Tax=Bacillus rossius redtenbacheri TaxID=93214 RepID=UPI002FDDC1D4